ncbi:MAG: Enoyl-CoA hydratase [uncultured Acidimicrobiales bacterium]|uniref:Enoyl-CoA hydratase n=1 Tax=uncultured Acidimicrobiales bacterium TaxID=310071 RepID=A0A6J4IPT8_9ACTN|nr:MAG: Enoyl-CoA hydratase [uncultured Acidimicrobiales bacterium]
MTTPLLRVDVDSDRRVAVLTLNHPERRNSLSLELVEGIIAAFDDLESRDDVGAVVITGAPPAFCAGADLSQLGESREEGLRKIYEGFLRAGRSPLPTIAAVNGAAVGAGMNLALCCDIRIAARRARFDTRFLELGLHPGGGHTWMLQRAVGPSVAAALVLFGEVLDGAAAERCGLAWRCVDDDALLETSITIAAKAAAAPPALARRVKDTMEKVLTVDDHETAVDVELEAQLWSMDQPDFAERLASLQQRISAGGSAAKG